MCFSRVGRLISWSFVLVISYKKSLKRINHIPPGDKVLDFYIIKEGEFLFKKEV